MRSCCKIPSCIFQTAVNKIDFLISKECQASIGALGSSRPIRNDVELNSSMRPTAEIKTVEVDEARLVEIIDTIKTRYQDIFVSSYR
jgi:ABC-type Fe3+ transport system substrate-binding protein